MPLGKKLGASGQDRRAHRGVVCLLWGKYENETWFLYIFDRLHIRCLTPSWINESSWYFQPSRWKYRRQMIQWTHRYLSIWRWRSCRRRRSDWLTELWPWADVCLHWVHCFFFFLCGGKTVGFTTNRTPPARSSNSKVFGASSFGLQIYTFFYCIWSALIFVIWYQMSFLLDPVVGPSCLFFF